MVAKITIKTEILPTFTLILDITYLKTFHIMRKLFFILLSIAVSTLQAQDIIYNRNDSIFVTRLLHKYGNNNIKGGKLILAIAKEFMGAEYVAGTLEKGINEPLVINTAEVDCTTFIEQVLAIYATIKGKNHSFNTMCSNLELIRYRGGVRCGYASRLHYISQWIADSAKQHIIYEIDYGTFGKESKTDLHYMSRHPASYKQLQKDSTQIKEIERWERTVQGATTRYIPKTELYHVADTLPIRNGDIIALTTNIKGLDVTHIGIAFWKEGKLRLLHASSAKGKVVKEEKTLFEYQKSRKSQTGIRVFRVK